MIFEAAHQMGLVPLVWLAALHFRGKDLDEAWWWIAGAFFVSWLADTAAHFTGHPMVSTTYPVLQSGLVGAVFLFKRDAIKYVLALMVIGVVAILWRGVTGRDVLLHTVAWLSVVGIVYPIWQLGRLRTSLLVYFGMGWWFWLMYAASPGWVTWSGYQIIRLAGILLFCWAATSPEPHLKLTRSGA